MADSSFFPSWVGVETLRPHRFYSCTSMRKQRVLLVIQIHSNYWNLSSGMGTELQHLVNFSFTSPKNNLDAVTIERVESASFKHLQEAMERFHEHCSNRESMKKTMLKHDEIFKEQVRELHRVYRVQKLLMAELRNKELKLHSLEDSATPVTIGVSSDYMHNTDNSQTGFWSSGIISPTSHSLFSNRHTITGTNSDYNFHQQYKLRLDPNLQELNSICSRDTFRRQTSFDLEQPAEDENLSNEQIPTFLKDKLRIDSPRDHGTRYEQESEIELTLSTGYSVDRKKQKDSWRTSKNLELGCCSDSGIPSASSVRLDCLEKREGRFKVEEMRGDECDDSSSTQLNRKPPWLLPSSELQQDMRGF